MDGVVAIGDVESSLRAGGAELLAHAGVYVLG
jgi:hypothetical protein